MVFQKKKKLRYILFFVWKFLTRMFHVIILQPIDRLPPVISKRNYFHNDKSSWYFLFHQNFTRSIKVNS